jgi:hypothetical protein
VVVSRELEMVTVDVEAVEVVLQPIVVVVGRTAVASVVAVEGVLEEPTTRTSDSEPERVIAAYMSNVACSLIRV